MDSIKWKCKNGIVYFEESDNSHLFHLIVEKLDVFNFHPIFFNFFQKWKYYKKEKQEFGRLLIFFTIKMLGKSKKVELNEDFVAIWREEQSLCDIMSSLHGGKYEKDKNQIKKVK